MKSARFRRSFKLMFRVISVNGVAVQDHWRDYGYSPRLYTEACELREQLGKYARIDNKVYQYDFKVVHEKFIVNGRLVDGRGQLVA